MTTPEAQGGRSFAADPIVEAPAELPAEWITQLVSCVVDENVGLPDAAVLTYRDPDHELLKATGITIGTALRVSVVTVQGQARELLFTGEVTALELDSDTTGSFTVVRAYSKAHRLQRGRKVVAYRNMTAAAIVRKVAAGAGLACGRVEAAPITYKQLSQANVSDWDFLQFLAGESGAQVRVDDKGLLQFTKPKPAASAPAPSTSATQSPLVLEHPRNLLALRAVLTGADGAGNVEVRGWDVNTKTPLVTRQPSVISRTVTPGMKPSVVSSAFGGSSRVTVTDMPYRTQAETEAVAKSVAASVSSGFTELEAVVEGNPMLRAGVPVALGNVGPAFSGRYTATAAHHVLEPHGGYRTTVLVSTSPDRSLAGLADRRQRALPGAAHAGPRDRRGVQHPRAGRRRAGLGAPEVPVARRGLRDGLGTHRAVGRQGRRRCVQPGGQRRGAGRFRAGAPRCSVRHRRPVQRRGQALAAPGCRWSTTRAARSTGVPWCPVRAIASSCSTPRAGDPPGCGSPVATTGSKCGSTSAATASP